MANEEVQTIRRVVTGHDAGGVAKVLIDGNAGNVKQIGPGASSVMMWCTDAMPADIAIGEDVEDLGSRILGTPPPQNGTRFAVNTIPPGSRGHMHRSETLDYVIVLSGEIDMDLDDSSVTLKAGDILIQRGTNHAWMNRGSVPARLAFVLIDATPLHLGKAIARDANAHAD
jgi:quercetin dioxygenase-like cupin family protein